MSVGINTQDSQLTFLIQDQKLRIQQLESALKQPTKNNPAFTNIVNIHEEFVSKIEQLTEKTILEK